jgi:hypothetical protein
MLVVIGTDCIGSCKSNYYMITTMTAHNCFKLFYHLKICWENNMQDDYAHNGGVHVHGILIFIKYLIMTGSWTLCPCDKKGHAHLHHAYKDPAKY